MPEGGTALHDSILFSLLQSESLDRVLLASGDGDLVSLLQLESEPGHSWC